ncbi:hypothetical protein Tco_1295161, partial [Tanacetum coccineum]
EVPSFDGPEPQPLLNSPSLDVSLGDVIGPEPPIKPHNPGSSRMKGLESKEVSPLGEELSLFDRPNKVERGRILEAHRLESILQQQISQCMAPSYHDGRKAHLLEDKQKLSVGVFDEVYSAFGRHLEEIHVTWAHLEKKRTRLRTYTNISRISTQRQETASQITRDAVTIHTKTASQDLKTASECTTQPII